MGKLIMPHADVLPQVETASAVALPVANATESSPMVGAAINGRVHPGGRPCTWYVEYGPTSGYGSSTPPRALPGQLTAHHVETFDGNTNGWRGGLAQTSLVYQSGEGGFVRYTTEGPSGDDDNHTSGIGMIHLPCLFYCGWFEVAPPQYLGGGLPDLRNAQLTMKVRGNSYVPNGSGLSTWIQVTEFADKTIPPRNAASNWAHTAVDHVSHTASGNWEDLSWTLRNQHQFWTYAGRNEAKDIYFYKELDATLGAVNGDIFPLQILYVGAPPRPLGTLDFDSFTMAYRNHNVLARSNGGHLVAQPAGGSDAEILTDGYRNGLSHEWVSGATPTGPLEFEWILVNPVVLKTVMVFNSTTYPSKTVTVLVSSNNGATYTSLGALTLPANSTNGPNYLFQRQAATNNIHNGVFVPLLDAPINRVKVRISDAYQSSFWGLGAVELFGTGAEEETEDDWYDVNQDIELAAGTWHYRIVASTADGSTYGTDHTVVVS